MCIRDRAGAGSKGWAVRPLKRYASWVQNVVRQFGPYPARAEDVYKRQLMQLAKTLGISVFIVGHVTKDGAVAGPRTLEHMVDTCLLYTSRCV